MVTNKEVSGYQGFVPQDPQIKSEQWLGKLKESGILPIGPDVIVQNELPSSKPEIVVSETDQKLLSVDTAGAVIQEDSSPVAVATPPQNK